MGCVNRVCQRGQVIFKNLFVKRVKKTNVLDPQYPARTEDEGGLCLTECGKEGLFVFGYRARGRRSCGREMINEQEKKRVNTNVFLRGLSMMIERE